MPSAAPIILCLKKIPPRASEDPTRWAYEALNSLFTLLQSRMNAQRNKQPPPAATPPIGIMRALRPFLSLIIIALDYHFSL